MGPIPPAVERLVRTICGRIVTIAQVIAIDENDSTQDAAVVDAGLVRLLDRTASDVSLCIR